MKKIPALRYENLFKQINKFKPTSIMEIGVWLGDTAVKMIKTAQQHNPQITYLGFDLFENITDEEIILEHSKLRKAIYDEVYEKLHKTGADIYLYQGYTRNTLPEVSERPIDFIFIDGGHSPETIQSDWDNIQKFIGPETIVIFDDYFYDKTDLGCKLLIDSLGQSNDNKWKVNLLEPIDHFPKEGWTQHTQMVKVVQSSSSSSSISSSSSSNSESSSSDSNSSLNSSVSDSTSS